MAKREHGIGVLDVNGKPVVTAFEIRAGKELRIHMTDSREGLELLISSLEMMRAYFPESKPSNLQ